MKTVLEDAPASDSQLVESCLLGNRDAFAQIVARYQSVVCSIAYSMCGDLGRSEDLAQDTFVSAWKSMTELKEPEKLKTWLCGIARNLANSFVRRQQRTPTALTGPEPPEGCSGIPTPHEQAVSNEEQALMWRVLETIPETYREPMILFYRANQSAPVVAAALGISEDVARQRLTRGRAMLTERVAKTVESALLKSAPGKAFTLGVVAALPFAATSAKAASMVTMAATASSGAKGAGILQTIGSAAGMLGAYTGAFTMFWGQIQHARSVREREFLARACWGFLVWLISIPVTIYVAASFSGGNVIINNMKGAVHWDLVWVALLGAWVCYSIWMKRRQRQIQMEDGTLPEGPSDFFGRIDPTRRGAKAIVYGGLASVIFGLGTFFLQLAHYHHGGKLVFIVISVLAVVTWLVSAGAVMRRPERIKGVFVALLWGIALLTLATLNLRWHVLVNNPKALWPDDPDKIHLAPFFVNFLFLVFYCSLDLALRLKRHFVATRNLKRDATVAAIVFFAVFLIGIVYVCL